MTADPQLRTRCEAALGRWCSLSVVRALRHGRTWHGHCGNRRPTYAAARGTDFEGGEYKTRPGPVRDAATKRFSSLAIPLSSIAVLGDMDNDPAKFRKAGVSIAIGNASPEVKRQANHVTASNTDDGFDLAIERFVPTVMDPEDFV